MLAWILNYKQMVKIIENKVLKQRRSNLKHLQILINQYVKHNNKRILIKIKNEQ